MDVETTLRDNYYVKYGSLQGVFFSFEIVGKTQGTFHCDLQIWNWNVKGECCCPVGMECAAYGIGCEFKELIPIIGSA